MSETKRYESRHPDLEAWIEIPDVWLSGDYDTYVRAYVAAQDAGFRHPTAQLAGVLALIQDGRIKAEVPGVEWDDEGKPNLKTLNAVAEGFLRNVAILLEATQVVPFGLSSPSANGTGAKGKD